jgi:hypothetical protein
MTRTSKGTLVVLAAGLLFVAALTVKCSSNKTSVNGTGGSSAATDVPGAGGASTTDPTGSGGAAGLPGATGTGGLSGNGGSGADRAAAVACQTCELASGARSCNAAYLSATRDANGDPVGWGFETLSTQAQRDAGAALLRCLNANNCSKGNNPILGCYCSAGVAATDCLAGVGLAGVCIPQYQAAATASEGGPPAGSSAAVFAGFISTRAFDPAGPIGMADSIKQCAIDSACAICGSL